MHNTPNFYEYIQQIQQYVQWQAEQIRVLNEQVNKLQQEVEHLKKTKNMTVERIEYKFDQLKVERLDGTLNIGLTPNGSGTIEDLNLNQQHFEDYPLQTHSASPLFSKIRSAVDEYLNHDIHNDLSQIEKKSQIHLEDENYRNVIIEDIKKQIDDRIHLYIKEVDQDQENDDNEVEQKITSKIKKDIQNGIENFFANFFQKGS